MAVLAAVWLLYLLSPLDLIPEAVFGLVSFHFMIFRKLSCLEIIYFRLAIPDSRQVVAVNPSPDQPILG